jgi:plasmid stabilization system protein ParE
VSLPVVLRAEAEAEFDEAFDFYDARRGGLGSAFASTIQTVFDSIGANPLIHRVVLADIRKAVVRRFPYCIYYRPHPDRVEVIAVFHTSRDPSIWQGRV